MASLASPLAEVRHRQGRLIGRLLGLGMDLQLEASRNVEGIVDMMLDATQKYSKLLTEDRLVAWHASLFPAGQSGLHRIQVGNWRTGKIGAMQVVSGPSGKEKVHFEAPSADRLKPEMDQFLQWFESPSKVDPVLKAGIAHLWFVTIHPFEDGNGRIGRAIADKGLARADGIPQRSYSHSSQIESDRKEYYLQLEKQQRSTPEITGWLTWFLVCLDRAITQAENTLTFILQKAQLRELINQQSINERQRKIINRKLEDGFEGYMNTSRYAKLAKCSADTALRDIQGLKHRGILIQNPGAGRSTSYRLIEPLPETTTISR